MFPTIEYAARLSHFDPKSDYQDFRGFFVLFWVALTIMVITAMLRNVKENGVPLMFSQWATLTENLFELAFSEILMGASLYPCLGLQLLYLNSKGLCRWNYRGMAIQAIFQTAWLVHWIR
jgi:sterol O-acyltransferase